MKTEMNKDEIITFVEKGKSKCVNEMTLAQQILLFINNDYTPVNKLILI
jgi:hypothetical protein